jgi:transketolase
MRRAKMQCAKRSGISAGPEDKQFYVPEDALAHFRKAIDRGAKSEKEWNELVSEYGKKHEDLSNVFQQTMSGELPADWEEHLPSFDDAEAIATRVASGKVINALAPHMPMLIGVRPILAFRTTPTSRMGGSFEAGSYDGRIIHFGVREHAMGATMTGWL